MHTIRVFNISSSSIFAISIKLISFLLILTAPILKSWADGDSSRIQCFSWRAFSGAPKFELSAVLDNEDKLTAVEVHQGKKLILSVKAASALLGDTDCSELLKEEVLQDFNFDGVIDLVIPDEMYTHCEDVRIFTLDKTSLKFKEVTDQIHNGLCNFTIHSKDKTFSTGDGKVCSASLSTYHWKNGRIKLTERSETTCFENGIFNDCTQITTTKRYTDKGVITTESRENICEEENTPTPAVETTSK